MKEEVSKDENELCYANVEETEHDNKDNSKMGRIQMIMARQVFKWTVVVILVTLMIITVVVPIVLEMPKQGTSYHVIIQRLLQHRQINENKFYKKLVSLKNYRSLQTYWI